VGLSSRKESQRKEEGTTLRVNSQGGKKWGGLDIHQQKPSLLMGEDQNCLYAGEKGRKPVSERRELGNGNSRTTGERGHEGFLGIVSREGGSFK